MDGSDGNRAVPVGPPDAVLKNHYGRRRAIPLSDGAAKILERVKEPAIFAALDLHNAALTMENHRFRLVNLWSALEYLPQLADHLQHYVAWLLSRIIQAFGKGTDWTMRDAWHLWKSKADFFRDSLPDKKGGSSHHVLTVGDVFNGDLYEPAYPI